MERAELLAAFTEEPGRLTRRFGTQAHAEAGAAVSDWMGAAGMAVRRDAVGNLIGRYEAGDGDAPALLLGSHLDTVPDAGRYDGALGVLAGIAAVERLVSAGTRLPFALEVVAFADEEGARFGTAFLGSSVLAGGFDAATLGRADADGVSLEEAIRAFGGDPGAARRGRASSPGRWSATPRSTSSRDRCSKSAACALGVVSGIAGQTRAALCFEGATGHAGTVPMELRRDALCAAAELVVEAEAVARETPGLVATVGELTPQPGAPNVIPGRARLSLDVRHADDAARAGATARLRERAGEIAAGRRVGLEWDPLHDQDAVRCDPELTEVMEQAVQATGSRSLRLPSGAGHDAAVLAAIAPGGDAVRAL